VLPSATTEGARNVAERLREATSERMQDLAPGVTVSIGVATIERGDTDASTLLARADQAMYAAKEAGRDRTMVAG
jgi:diguanylate cyclase (GGDEF)-like protein